MSRKEQISNFLKNNSICYNEIIKIAGDASFRSYYRILTDNNENFILMDAPPEFEDVRPFIKIDDFLRNNNFLAPKIFAQDIENGFLLLEDFGNFSYNKILSSLTTDDLKNKELDLYKKATDVLINLHKIENYNIDIAQYNIELLLKEVMIFIDWYLPYIIKKSPSQKQISKFKDEWLNIFKKLSDKKFIVLRDYHADNLMLTNNKVGLLDFQDAVLGSNAYDLVSLLEDARRDVSDLTAKEIIDYYLKNSKFNKEQFLIDYQILSLQRNIKILGIFARLTFRDKKEGYLKFLPRVLCHVNNRLKEPLFSNIKNILVDLGYEY